MSRHTKFALLALAALLAVGSSIATAGPKPDKEYTLTSVPVWGDGVTCVVANTTEQVISFHWDINFTDGSKIVDDSATLYAHESLGNGGPTGSLSYCVVSWVGQKDDLTAAMCS